MTVPAGVFIVLVTRLLMIELTPTDAPMRLRCFVFVVPGTVDGFGTRRMSSDRLR
jgi:uncharacterized membrane protein